MSKSPINQLHTQLLLLTEWVRRKMSGGVLEVPHALATGDGPQSQPLIFLVAWRNDSH